MAAIHHYLTYTPSMEMTPVEHPPPIAQLMYLKHNPEFTHKHLLDFDLLLTSSEAEDF